MTHTTARPRRFTNTTSEIVHVLVINGEECSYLHTGRDGQVVAFEDVNDAIEARIDLEDADCYTDMLEVNPGEELDFDAVADAWTE